MSYHIYLIRHGQKRSEFGDPGLTDLGRQQAQKTAEYFFPLKSSIALLYSSPLSRTQETAKYIGQVLGLSVQLDERLRERANWGDLSGQTFADFEGMWVQATQDRDWKPPVGDSSRGAGDRMFSAAGDLQLQSGKSAIFVTHGGVICDMVRNMFSPKETDRLMPQFSVLTDELAHECSITEIEFDRETGSAKLLQLLSIDHLPTDLR